jgi:hypothetical protein
MYRLSVIVVLVLACLVPISASANTTSAPAKVIVVAGCYSNPERTTITNRTGKAITVLGVGTLYKPRSNEPFGRRQSLANGASITFLSGSAASKASPLTLTRQFIYNDDIRDEGARVSTSVGTFTDLCG